MAKSALRTLCIAYKYIEGNIDLEKEDSKGVKEIETKDLTFLAIIGIRDVLRKEVPDAVAKCKTA